MTMHTHHTKHTPETIAAALSYIPATLPHDEWKRMGMAIKDHFPNETGFDLFNTWSSTAPSYKPRECRAAWNSFDDFGPVKIGTLLRLAKSYGFVIPKQDQTAARPSPAEQAALRARAKEAAAAEAARRAAEHEGAAAEAQAFWEGNCSDATDPGQAPYLARKGVLPFGVRFDRSSKELVIPLRDAAGVLWNLQRIAPSKPARGPDKIFTRGGKKSGLWHMLGQPEGAAVVLVAEGYATAASLHEATGLPVAVAFDAGNLAHVSKALHRQHPGALLVLCADNDAATEARTGTNPGLQKAMDAAGAVAGVVACPPRQEGQNVDFNDLHQAQGVEAVATIVQGAIAQHASQVQAQASEQPPKAAATGQRPRKQRQAAPDDEAPTFDPFTVDDGGVWFQGVDKDGSPARPLWLCGRLDVVARTNDADGHGWGFLLRFADPLGREKTWPMPARLLAGDGGEYRATLLNLGLSLSPTPTARHKLTEFLQTRRPAEFATCVDRAGWHPSDGRAVFVTSQDVIGEPGEQRIVFQSDSYVENFYRQRGTAAAWRERVGVLCTGNSRAMFAASCAFAAPLLRPAGMESGGFHLRGDSSSGKTTCLRVAASVMGGANYMQRWRTTSNALEGIAAQFCDGLLILDELAQVDGKEAGEAAYLLANEQGKARAQRGGTPRPRLSWKTLFLSAGEISLTDHMSESGKRARTGQELRMVDIPADAGKGKGAFEVLNGQASPAAFAGHLNHEAAACHGAPGRAFLQWCAANWDGLGARLRTQVQALVAEWVGAGASGQVLRVARRFALVAAAGELATEIGLTGWDNSESEWAARTCFDAWLAARGGDGNGEVQAMLRQVRRFLELHGEGRFTWWHRAADDHSAKTLQRAGFRRLLGVDGKPVHTDSAHEFEYGQRMAARDGERAAVEFFVLPEVFRSEMCAGFAGETVARVLKEYGCLETEAERFTVKPRLPGMGPARCYHIKPEIFALDL